MRYELNFTPTCCWKARVNPMLLTEAVLPNAYLVQAPCSAKRVA